MNRLCHFLCCDYVHFLATEKPLVAKKLSFVQRSDGMGMTQCTIVVGVFREPAQARRAVDELRQAGYTEDGVGYLTRASTRGRAGDTGTFLANSAREGSLVR